MKLALASRSPKRAHSRMSSHLQTLKQNQNSFSVNFKFKVSLTGRGEEVKAKAMQFIDEDDYWRHRALCIKWLTIYDAPFDKETAYEKFKPVDEFNANCQYNWQQSKEAYYKEKAQKKEAGKAAVREAVRAMMEDELEVAGGVINTQNEIYIAQILDFLEHDKEDLEEATFAAELFASNPLYRELYRRFARDSICLNCHARGKFLYLPSLSCCSDEHASKRICTTGHLELTRGQRRYENTKSYWVALSEFTYMDRMATVAIAVQAYVKETPGAGDYLDPDVIEK